MGNAPKLASFLHSIGLSNVSATDLDFNGNPGQVKLASDLGPGKEHIDEAELAFVASLVEPDRRFYDAVEEEEAQQWDRPIEPC
jgi:hypothetical protein